ncbi:MAG: hypothetical protein RLQ12_17295, partial [Cyclobacteriaceae bacterium]
MRNLFFLATLIILSSACKEEFVSVDVYNTNHGVVFISASDLQGKNISFNEEVELPIFFTDNPNRPLISQPLYGDGELKGFLVKADSLKQVTV